jgi:hypothetical protein
MTNWKEGGNNPWKGTMLDECLENDNNRNEIKT